ncbi:MAG: hypothetical protein GYA68_14445 [Syntrophorhabdus sp.]|nr:hypothetical protein [Syntrophorhabdus sp.]
MKKKRYRLIILDSNLIIAKTLSMIAKQHYKVDDVRILPDDSVITADEITDVLKGLSDEYRIALNAESIFEKNSSGHTMKGLGFLRPIFNNGNLAENDPLILSFSTLGNLKSRVGENFRVLLSNEDYYRFVQLPVEISSLDIFFK